MSGDDETRAVGWDAIDAALKPIYDDRQPKHYGTIVPAFLGGKDPLQGISVYKNLKPLPHFHFVTYGFSELYEKESENRELSGYGFELTFRLACGDADEEPPVWALNFLQDIARYVFSTGNRLEVHHHIDLNGPIALNEDTEIRAIALVKDPQLGEIDSENGRVTFLQVVGLCVSEYELIKDWDCARMLEYIGRRWPLSITDLKRKSVLSDTALAAEIHAQAEYEGSSQAESFATVAEWEVQGGTLSVTLAATAARDVIKMLRSRLGHGKSFVVWGRQKGIAFKPNDRDGWELGKIPELSVLSLTPATIAAILQSLKAERGDYRWRELASVLIQVVPSEIKDQDGNVIQVIG